MAKILQFKGGKDRNTTEVNRESGGENHSNVITLIDRFKSQILDPYLLGTPSLSDLHKVKKLRDSFGRVEGYDYIYQYILSTVNKNYEMKLSKIPFFIINNINKCSKDELKILVELINEKVKIKKIHPSAREFLLDIKRYILTIRS